MASADGPGSSGADLTLVGTLLWQLAPEPGADKTVHLPYGIGRHRLRATHEQKHVRAAELQVLHP
jgi:hypothetical protein